MAVTHRWRGGFTNIEANKLHAEAFSTPVYDAYEWNWEQLVRRHSLVCVVARDGNRLVGFVNVFWDGLVHAWIQDTMVANDVRGQGVGTRLVSVAVEEARAAGCEWLHVDFEDHLRPFYVDVCGFVPTNGGSSRFDDVTLISGSLLGSPAVELDSFQDLMRRTYGDRDRARGTAATIAWLTEELGELSQAVRKGDRDQQLHELGDVLAWLASLAEQLGLSLSASAQRYTSGCPVCDSIPCICQG